jgi:hypothetical protein
MPEQDNPGRRPLTDWIPVKWSNQMIWLSAYRVHGFREPPELFRMGHQVIDLEKLQVRVIIHLCNFNFTPRPVGFQFRPFGRGFQADDSKELKPLTSTGLHIFFIAPVLGDREPGNPRHELGNVGTAVSLVAALCGRNAVFEHICDQDMTPNRDLHIAFSGSMEVPSSLGEPDLSTERLELLDEADHKIEDLQDSDKKRVVLSLRWLRMGFADVGVDAFLKYWIAVETLAANLRSINQMLSAGYSISLQETGEKFLIGRLQRLRGNIVHKGQIPADSVVLKRYLEAVYSDLLCAFLNLPFPRKAESYLSERRSEMSKLVASRHP